MPLPPNFTLFPYTTLFRSKFNEDPFSFYRHLRSSNPSPYMFYLDFTDYLIIGASPEALVQVTNNEVTTNPIAGTRPRGNNIVEDNALAKELLADRSEERRVGKEYRTESMTLK